MNVRAQDLCESRGGCPGLPSLINLHFFVDVTEPTSTNYECTFHMFTTCDIFMFYLESQNYAHSGETSK